MLPAYFTSRTGTIPERLPAIPSNVSTKALAYVLAGMQAAGNAAQTIVPTNVTDVQPSPTAQPVVLRVHSTAQSASDASDPLRGIAGVCLLLREQAAQGAPANPWSCINVAELDVLDAMNPMTYDDDTTGPSPVIAEDVTFVPHRLITRNGISQTALSYDNRPMAAPSPADDLTTYFKPTRSPDYGPIFEYSHVNKAAATSPSSTVGAWARMSGLKFGRSYDSIGFTVRNSGALPRLLADLNAPNETTGTQTVLPTAPLVPLSPDAFAPAAPTAAIAPFTYLRRTPVGQIRIRIADDTSYVPDLNQQSLPVIPPTVAPLAREADILNTVPNPAPTSTEGKLPLLMLWNSTVKGKPRNSYSFSVRPPAADPSVWDRWVAGMANDNSYRGIRAAVATDFALNAPKNMQDPSISSKDAISGKDVTLNDPAVTYVCFNVTSVYPANGSLTNVGQPRCIPVPPLLRNMPDTAILPDSGFNQVQGKLATVTVTMNNDASASLSVVDNTVTITIPAGQVWKLTMVPAIDPTTKGIFDVDATRSQFAGNPVTYQKPGTDTTSTVQLISSASPMEMLVEGAQQSTLTAQDLWQSMQFFVPDGIKTTSLTLSLTPKSGANWHLIRRVEVARQAWRWMGRPIFPAGSFPAMPPSDLNGIVPNGDSNDPLPALTSALNWEIQAFAERDYDASLTETSVIFQTGTSTDGSSSKQIHVEELATDLRSHYFRFGAYVEPIRGFVRLPTLQHNPGSVDRAKGYIQQNRSRRGSEERWLYNLDSRLRSVPSRAER